MEDRILCLAAQSVKSFGGYRHVVGLSEHHWKSREEREKEIEWKKETCSDLEETCHRRLMVDLLSQGHALGLRMGQEKFVLNQGITRRWRETF